MILLNLSCILKIFVSKYIYIGAEDFNTYILWRQKYIPL